MVTNKNIDDFDPALDELLRLPRFSPAPDFSDRVMSQLAAFQRRAPMAAPVAARQQWKPVALTPKPEFALPPAIARWVPASRPARYALGAFAVATSFATTAAAVIVASNLSLASFVGGLALDRMLMGITVWGAEAVNGAFGQTAIGYINAGASAQSALVMGGLAAGGIAAFTGLRKAASLNPRTV